MIVAISPAFKFIMLADEHATPFILSMTTFAVGRFNTKAGSPNNEYCSLLGVLSRFLSIILFFAKRCASPTEIGFPLASLLKTYSKKAMFIALL